MARPKFVQAKSTTLKVAISNTESSAIILRELVDLYGVALALTDFANDITFTFNPGGANEEIISCTAFTVNNDGSVTLNTGIVRGLEGVSSYSTGGTARNHAAGTVVVVSNNPQMYESILDYIDSVAIAGASDASLTGKGLTEIATTAEIDADEDFGATGAPAVVRPDQLAASKYGLYNPNANQKAFLNGVVGMILPYGGSSAPTGFNLCDASTLTLASYPLLGAVLLGRYGYGTAVTFTADAGTDVITAVSHGLSDGARVLLKSTTTLPAGLSANTIYFVRDSATNTFKLATSSGGSAIDITDAGTGTHSFYVSFKVPDLRARNPIGQGAGTFALNFATSAVDIATDIITLESNNSFYDGTLVRLTTTGTLPAGLSLATDYYVIRASATTIKLATSLANAIAETPTVINITDVGSGTHTITTTLSTRAMGEQGGEETRKLSVAELASHTHVADSIIGTPNNDARDAASDNVNENASGATGGNTPHNIMDPFTVVNYIIKTD